MSINKWNPYGPSSDGIVGHGPETPEMPTCSTRAGQVREVVF